MSKGSGNTRGSSPYQRAVTRIATRGGGSGASVGINSNGHAMTRTRADIDAVATSVKDMKNRDMQKEIQQAISRYEAVMGLRERSIKLAPLGDAYGATFIGADGSHGIYLDSKYFDVPKEEFEKAYRQDNYRRREGFKNTTRKPAQHTVTHELAHATWTSGYSSQKAQDAGNEIKALYKNFMSDTSTVRKKNYGSYGKSSVDEFWAEVITKGIHGDSDKYTRKAISIAKKYKL